MSEDICETVRVVDVNAPDGFVVINKSDYDPEVHKIFGVKQEEPKRVKK